MKLPESKFYRNHKGILACSWEDKKTWKPVLICSAKFTAGNEEITNGKGNIQIRLNFI